VAYRAGGVRKSLPVPVELAGAGALDEVKTRRLLGGLTDRVQAAAVAVRTLTAPTRRWPSELRTAGLDEVPPEVELAHANSVARHGLPVYGLPPATPTMPKELTAGRARPHWG